MQQEVNNELQSFIQRNILQPLKIAFKKHLTAWKMLLVKYKVKQKSSKFCEPNDPNCGKTHVYRKEKDNTLKEI